MAKIIKSKSRRNVAKAAKRAVTRVVTKTKTLYKRAKGINVTKKDVIVSVAAAGAGSVGGSIVLSKIASATDSKYIAIAKAAAVAAVGGYLTYIGVKKRNMAITGAGMGMASVGATNIIGKFSSAGSMAAPFVNPSLAAPLRVSRTVRVAAPFVKPLAGCKSKTDDYI